MSIYEFERVTLLEESMNEMIESEHDGGFFQGLADGFLKGVVTFFEGLIPNNWGQLILEGLLIGGAILLAMSPIGWVLGVIAVVGLVALGIAAVVDMGYQMIVNDASFGYALGHGLGFAGGILASGFGFGQLLEGLGVTSLLEDISLSSEAFVEVEEIPIPGRCI